MSIMQLYKDGITMKDSHGMDDFEQMETKDLIAMLKNDDTFHQLSDSEFEKIVDVLSSRIRFNDTSIDESIEKNESLKDELK